MFSLRLTELVDLLRAKHQELSREDIRKVLLDNIDMYQHTLTIPIEL